MTTSTPVPSSVTCFKNGLSHFTFPINFRPGLSPMKIGPLTETTINGSVSVIPDDENLKVNSITSENNRLIKVHYVLDNPDEDGKGNLNYISEGIKWTPVYLMKVNPESKKLIIGGRATIVSKIAFLDDVTLPQLSLVSGAPNIACQGEYDPLVMQSLDHHQNKRVAHSSAYMMGQQQAPRGAGVFGAAANMEEDAFEDEEFGEEKVGELYHFKIRHVPMNFGKATSVPFMDDITDVPYDDQFVIKLDSHLANNEGVPAKHFFKFPMKYAPPLPRGPIMIYLKKEGQLTFFTQTRLKTDSGMFSLETTNSSDVDAKFNITSGEKTTEAIEDLDKDGSKSRRLMSTSKLGNIVIKNRKKEEVKVQLIVTVQGTLVKDTFKDHEEVKIVEKPSIDDLNPEHTITLELTLAASIEKELKFEFLVKNWDVKAPGPFQGFGKSQTPI